MQYLKLTEHENPPDLPGGNDPLVSVIVPIYRIERYIGLCVESLLQQTYRNLEIILVNDGSPDRCGEICGIYERKDPRIRVIHKENGGLVSARQAGLAISNGSLICNVDGDDWVDPLFIEQLVRAQQQADADAVVAGQTRHFFQHQVQLRNRIPCGVYEGERLAWLKDNMLSCGEYYSIGIFTYLWNKLFKRDMIYRHQMAVDPRISQGEDAACVYPALNECKRISVIGDCSYHYRQREDSMLKSMKPFQEQLPGIRMLADHLREHLPQEYSGQVNDYLLHITTVRSGGILPGGSMGYPYQSDFAGDSLVLCSAGTYGQQLYSKLTEQGCRVEAWVDDDYWACRRCCLDVDPVEKILSVEFDKAVVAALDYESCENWRKRLLEMGIPEERICLINRDRTQRDLALRVYLGQ